ncbi:MAG: hypothetical protein Roseis2KO_37700 [Roseivirga sp.]
MKIIQRIILITLVVNISCGPDRVETKLDLFKQERLAEVNMLLDSSVNLTNSSKFKLASQFLDSLERIAKADRDILLLSGVLNNKGILNYKLGNFNESISLYEESINLDKAIGDSVGIGFKLKNIGISYKQKGNYKTALKYYLEALPIIQTLKIVKEEASINNSIGNVYNDLEEFEKSYEYYVAAQELWLVAGDSLRNSFALGNLGNSLLGLDRPKEAIAFYNQSLHIKRSLNRPSSVALTLNNLGEAFFKLKNWENARQNYLQSLEIRVDINEAKGIAVVSNNIAELEISQGNIKSAQQWLDKAASIAQELGADDVKLENTRLQKELYAIAGVFEKAYKTDLVYDELKQTNFDDEIIEVKDQQYAYDLDQEAKAKELFKARLESSEAQRESQRLRTQVQTYALIIIVLIALIIGYLALKLRKKNRHIENLMRELHHRVKNHLGMISGMFGAQSEQGTATNADLLEEAKTRVEAVNGIHRRLYRQDEYEFVNMQEYLTELVDNSALVFGLYQNIHKELKIDSEPLEIDKAISVGLIANEVLTNTFKYGLQKADEPVLKIVLEKAVKGYRMIIFNNAAPDQKPITESTGFGKELIKRLTANLKGESRTIQQNGFQFELTFP